MSPAGSNLSDRGVALSARDDPRDEHLARVEIALLALVFATAALLNSALALRLLRRRERLSRMRALVLHLCAADLGVALFQVCPQLVWEVTDRFWGPDALCRAVKFLQGFGMFSSSYVVVAMTADRYRAVCDPLARLRKGARRWAPVRAAWCAALAGALPQVFVFSRVQVAPGVFDCWAVFARPWGRRAYVTWIALAVFVVPVGAVLACQVRICRAVGARGQAPPLTGARAPAPPLTRARAKTVRMSVVLVLAYVICWAPFFTVQLWAAWDTHAPIESPVFTVLMLLSSLSSCANPCIYLLLSGELPNLRLRPGGRKACAPEAPAALGSVCPSFKSLSDCR